MTAGSSPEGCQSSRTASQMLSIRPSHAEAECALAGNAVAQRIAAIAPVCDANRIRVEPPDGCLECVAPLFPLVAKLIACLHKKQLTNILHRSVI